MRRRQLLALAARFAPVAAFALGTVFAGAAKAADPVKIGLLMPTKTLVGQQGVQGAELAVRMLNDQGGILGGRPIELVTYDTAFKPAEGVAAAQRLLTQDGVKMIAGEISSTVALAVIQVAQPFGAIFMAAVPKHPDVTKSGYDRVFRLNSTTSMDNKAFDSILVDEEKPAKVAVLAENTDYGRLVIAHMRELFGDKLAFSDTYEVTQGDFNSLVSNAKASGADLLCIAGSNMEQYGNIIRLTDELSFDADICVMPGILNSKGVSIAGKAAEGAFSADIYVPSLDNAANKAFVAAFEKAYGHKPEKIEELGFESIWILAKAADKAGTADDMGKVAETIRSNSWQTPRGDVTFDADGQASSGNVYQLVVKDGELQVAQ